MSASTLYELMGTQRAVRRLRPDPIPDDVMARILKASTWAPTGGNQQPWRMIVVQGGDKKRALGEHYTKRWARFSDGYRARIADLPAEEKAKQERTIDAGDYLCAHFHEVPAVVIVCFNPKMMAITDAKLDRISVVGGASVYTAVQNLLLACRAEGVGCVLTTLLCEVEPEVKSLLSIPDSWHTAAAVPMGYPVGTGYGPITRLPVADLFFKDGWKEPSPTQWSQG